MRKNDELLIELVIHHMTPKQPKCKRYIRNFKTIWHFFETRVFTEWEVFEKRERTHHNRSETNKWMDKLRTNEWILERQPTRCLVDDCSYMLEHRQKCVVLLGHKCKHLFGGCLGTVGVSIIKVVHLSFLPINFLAPKEPERKSAETWREKLLAKKIIKRRRACCVWIL